jgi:hypothetical protein
MRVLIFGTQNLGDLDELIRVAVAVEVSKQAQHRLFQLSIEAPPSDETKGSSRLETMS